MAEEGWRMALGQVQYRVEEGLLLSNGLPQIFSAFNVEKVIQFYKIDFCSRNTRRPTARFEGTCTGPKYQDCRNFV